MSRIGKLPVVIPAGVTVEMKDNNVLSVKGPKGTLEKQFAPEIGIEQKDGEIVVTRPNDNKKEKSLHGLTRSLIQNMVIGVTEGFEKKLEINGVGYRAEKKGKVLTLHLGFSHPVEMTDPDGIESVLDGNNITVKGTIPNFCQP